MQYIIDRFEGNMAVIELPDKTTVDIPRIVLPPEAAEGDTITVTIDRDATADRQNRIKSMEDDLFI